MPKAPVLPPSVQKATGIFATVLIVAGIVTVAYVSSDKSRNMVPSPSQTGGAPSSTEMTGPQIILKSDHAITVMSMNGQSERFETYEAFHAAHPNAVQLNGADAATGAPVSFTTSTAAEGAHGLPAPRHHEFATLGDAQSDGAGTVSVTSENGESKRIVARFADGKPLRITSVTGWFDDETIAVLGTQDDARVLAALPLVGAATVVRKVEENVLFVYARSGYAWLMTGVSGAGLESPPSGPSDLIRVGKDGKELKVARDELRVISSVQMDSSNHIAYTTDDGQSFVLTVGDAASKAALGSRRPLQFLPDGRLLIRDKFDLAIFDPSTGGTTKIGSLPEGGIQLFLFEETP
jgi:hypothetical protein